uniref:Ribosomal protein L5 n=1 Tax=Lotharella vacuolata TaxID=74820 RepID=A0A0H5BKZ1_9EUKA|nr:ribosomal protein L5 [Lotharella vacuolata]
MTVYKILKNASYFSNFCTKHRRNREKRTNYNKKFNINNSILFNYKNIGFKCVFRKSNYCISSYLVYPSIVGDFIIIVSNSKELFKYGYSNSAKHSFASYFLGLLCARKFFMKFNIYEKKYILTFLDIGFQKASGGSKVYIFIKGMTQGGIQIPFSIVKKSVVDCKDVFNKLKTFFYNNCFIKIRTIKQTLISLSSPFIVLNSKNIYKYFFRVFKNNKQIYYNIINYCHIKFLNNINIIKNIWNLNKKNYLEKKILYLSKIQILVNQIVEFN